MNICDKFNGYVTTRMCYCSFSSTLLPLAYKVLWLLKEHGVHTYYMYALSPHCDRVIFIAKLRPECGAASTWLSQQHY